MVDKGKDLLNKAKQPGMGMTRAEFLQLSALTVGGVLTTGVLTSCGTTTKSGLKQASLRLLWLPQAQFAGDYVALDKGFYKEEGIEMTVSPGGPNLYPLNLVASQTDTFGVMGPSAVIQGRDKSLPLKNICMDFGKGQDVMVAKKDSGINRPKDFEGKKIAIYFGELQFRVRAMVKFDGGDPTKMIEIPQGGDLSPFINGEWDVCSTVAFNELITLRDEKNIPLNTFDVNDYGVGFPVQGLSCADKVIAQDPEMVKSFVKAHIRGWKYAIENPDEAVDIVMKFGEMEKGHQVAMLKEVTKLIKAGKAPTMGLGYINPDDFQKTIDFLFENEFIAAKPNLADCIWADAWNAVPDSVKKM
jgi:NitT/TauT family transport system substrate-binding protein